MAIATGNLARFSERIEELCSISLEKRRQIPGLYALQFQTRQHEITIIPH